MPGFLNAEGWRKDTGNQELVACRREQNIAIFYALSRLRAEEQGTQPGEGERQLLGSQAHELYAIVCVMGMCCCTRGSSLASLIFNSPP